MKYLRRKYRVIEFYRHYCGSTSYSVEERMWWRLGGWGDIVIYSFKTQLEARRWICNLIALVRSYRKDGWIRSPYKKPC